MSSDGLAMLALLPFLLILIGNRWRHYAAMLAASAAILLLVAATVSDLRNHGQALFGVCVGIGLFACAAITKAVLLYVAEGRRRRAAHLGPVSHEMAPLFVSNPSNGRNGDA